MTQRPVDAAIEAEVETFVFISSSPVSGETPRPTPEDYALLEPISTYVASKLANESLLSPAAHS